MTISFECSKESMNQWQSNCEQTDVVKDRLLSLTDSFLVLNTGMATVVIRTGPCPSSSYSRQADKQVGRQTYDNTMVKEMLLSRMQLL